MKRFVIFFGLLVLLGSFNGPASSTPLWYNGDGIYGIISNSQNMSIESYVYDDFVVPSGGWTVNTVWSNNVMTVPVIVQASWEIRSGVLEGNGGTLVASGTGEPTLIRTGRSYSMDGESYDEYTVQVSGLNVKLAPGTYWLKVTPIGMSNESEKSWITITNGVNAVGQPLGNNGNSFIDSVSWGNNFSPLNTDLSMGIDGSAVPLPGAVWLLGTGLLGLTGLRRFRKS